jgi:hypothetical protein
MTNKVVVYIISFLLFALIFCQNVYSWDNEVTHRDLSGYAAEISVLEKNEGDYLKNLGFENALDEYFLSGQIRNKVREWLREGAFLEDEASSSDTVTGRARYNNHFHNPLKPWSAAGLSDLQNGESSIMWAQDSVDQEGSSGGDWSWRKVRLCYYDALTAKTESDRQAFFAGTFEGLGYQMHLIQDMSVPAHVRNDAHPEDALLGGLKIDWYLESWAKKNYITIDSFALFPAIPNVSLDVSRNGLAPITQFVDSEQYDGSMPSTSLTWGLAEYTNANFVSDDTIFTEDRDINDKHYFPYPRFDSNSYEIYEVEHSPVTKRIYLRKKGDGESAEHFATAGPLLKFLSFDPVLQKDELKLDRMIYKDYSEKLIPRAVGYSAALIDYFFRGDIDLVPDDAKGSGYVIVNNTKEDMNGTFELWYDDNNEERNKVWSDSVSIGNKNSNDNKSANIDFEPPADAKERNIYTLVFRGEMGSEEDAVVGKRIKVAEPVTGRLVWAERSVNGQFIFLDVFTESGLISGMFNIANTGIIAVRFNLSNYDEVIVVAGQNEFHKFTIDEGNKTITYDGVVAEYPRSTTDKVTDYTCFEEGSPSDCVYFDDVPGPFREIHHWFSEESSSVGIRDFYYDGDLIKPFGQYFEGYRIFTTRSDYCGDREMAIDNQNTYKSRLIAGIYYGAKLMGTSTDYCVGDESPQFSCSAEWDGLQCTPIEVGTEIETDEPVALFNASDFAYSHYRYPYGKSPSGCNYMVELASPVSMPCSVDVASIKTMLRKDGGQSFYYNDPDVGWLSYSSGLGIIEGRYLISNDNPPGSYIGWDDSGHIVRVYYDNGKLTISKLKTIGGLFSGHFDVALKNLN